MRWMLLLIAALALTGCATTEIVVAHPDSGITVTTRFIASDALQSN
jgi:hypothetical protein